MVFQPRRLYTWNENFGGFSVDANVVGGVCEQIEEKNGSVTKENFLEASRPDDSPTHSMFVWSDAEAAELYRLDTASKIIGCLRITYINTDKEEVSVKAFVNTSEIGDKAQYESVDVVLKEEDKRLVYLNRIKKELDSFIKRNANIEELADILIEAGMKLKKK